MFLAGNKSDLANDAGSGSSRHPKVLAKKREIAAKVKLQDSDRYRQVDFLDGQKLAKENDMIFMETSAKTSFNCLTLIQTIIRQFPKKESVRDDSVIIVKNQP